MEPLLKYFPLVKIDEAAHMVWGIVTSETPDADNEICDYEFAKKSIKEWSDDTLAKTTAAGQDPSLGNMRVMHQLTVGGKAIKVEYKDSVKQVWVGSEPANDEVWHLLKGGFLTSHSIGGSYAWKKPEGEYKRYGPTIGEISYVDRGSNPDASFAYVKADGTTELRKFAKPGPEEKQILEKLQKASLANLSEADIERLMKSATSELDTRLEKIDSRVADLVRQLSPQGDNMNPEQIKKCAAALGITEAEFQAQYLDEGKPLAKGHSMAALHAAIEKAHGHHEDMMAMHEKMGKAHAAMATHLGKCMKSAKSLMGSEEDAEKATKALMDELKIAPVETEEEKIAKARAAAEKRDPITVTNTELAALIKSEVEKGVKEAVEKLPKNDNSDRAQLFAVARGSEIKKAEAIDASDPFGGS